MKKRFKKTDLLKHKFDLDELIDADGAPIDGDEVIPSFAWKIHFITGEAGPVKSVRPVCLESCLNIGHGLSANTEGDNISVVISRPAIHENLMDMLISYIKFYNTSDTIHAIAMQRYFPHDKAMLVLATPSKFLRNDSYLRLGNCAQRDLGL